MDPTLQNPGPNGLLNIERALQTIADRLSPRSGLVQLQYTQYDALATGTTLIPQDNTIPQNTEGDQYMVVTITPKDTQSIIEVDVLIFVSTSAAGAVMTAALFKDTETNARAASSNFLDAAATFSSRPLRLKYYMQAGTTDQIQFSVRAGAHVAGTTSFNGVSATNRYGTTVKSVITAKEYRL